jgi:ubiquinone biosynthesis protein COQ9
MVENPPNPEECDAFEKTREKILRQALLLSPFGGWNDTMLAEAATAAKINPAHLAAAFPGGVGDVLRYWSAQTDRAMAAAMDGLAFDSLKIRDKVAFAIRARLDHLRPHKEAVRRAAATLALPGKQFLAAELSWKTADAVWRGLGDASTDLNYYTKRAILAGLWTNVMARWFGDNSDDEAPTRAFLDARIENVMQFEKAKARLRDMGPNPAKLIEYLARLRYPGAKTASGGSKKADREAKIDEALKETFPASDPPYWTGGI